MAHYEGREFTGEALSLDEHSFRACRLVDCVLDYCGEGRPDLADCVLEGSYVRFGGAAAHTVEFLQTLGRSGADSLDTVLRILFRLPEEDHEALRRRLSSLPAA